MFQVVNVKKAYIDFEKLTDLQCTIWHHDVTHNNVCVTLRRKSHLQYCDIANIWLSSIKKWRILMRLKRNERNVRCRFRCRYRVYTHAFNTISLKCYYYQYCKCFLSMLPQIKSAWCVSVVYWLSTICMLMFFYLMLYSTHVKMMLKRTWVDLLSILVENSYKYEIKSFLVFSFHLLVTFTYAHPSFNS